MHPSIVKARELLERTKHIGSNERAAIVHKTVSKQTRGLDFILSDATPDRYQDIIMSDGWQLANFKKNPIALFAHRSDFPIGTWKNVRVEDAALRGTLELAPRGTSARINELHRLIEADVLKAVSVGFSPIEYEERKGDTYGLVYLKQELIECSLVSVPANPNALQVAKELKISADTQAIAFLDRQLPDSKINTLEDYTEKVLLGDYIDLLREEWRRDLAKLRQELKDES